MRSYSMRLACVGALIGVLTVSAAAFVNLTAGRNKQTPPVTTAAVGTAPETADTGPALQLPEPFRLPVLLSAEQSVPAQTEPEPAPETDYRVALRIAEPLRDCHLFVCDLRGNPLEEILPDAAGDAELGPLAPGRYAVTDGTAWLGAFLLADNAAVPEATGQLWADGEVLYLESFCSGQAEIRLTLPDPGYYSFQLVDDLGSRRFQDLFIPKTALPEEGRSYLRTLVFRGLPQGRYTLVRNNRPLVQFQVLAGGTVRIDAAPED